MKILLLLAWFSFAYGVIFDIKTETNGTVFGTNCAEECHEVAMSDDPVNVENSALLLAFLRPRKGPLFADVDGSDFETCNENNQTVLNGKLKQTHDVNMINGPIILCWDSVATTCPNGVTIFAKSWDKTTLNRTFTKDDENSRQVVVTQRGEFEDSNNVTQFTFDQHDLPYGCIYTKNTFNVYDSKYDWQGISGKKRAYTVYDVIIHGDPGCAMTVTYFNYHYATETDNVCEPNHKQPEAFLNCTTAAECGYYVNTTTSTSEAEKTTDAKFDTKTQSEAFFTSTTGMSVTTAAEFGAYDSTTTNTITSQTTENTGHTPAFTFGGLAASVLFSTVAGLKCLWKVANI